MNRTVLTPRRKLAITGLVVTLPLLASGCGFGIQTNQVYQPAVGANNRSEDVDVLGAVVVSSEVGEGTVVTTLVDNSETADRLTGVTATTGTEVGDVSPVELPSQTPVDLRDEGITVSGPQVSAIKSNYVLLTFTFDKSDPVKINVPVVPDSGPYTDIGPTAPPSPPNDVASSGSTGALGGE